MPRRQLRPSSHRVETIAATTQPLQPRPVSEEVVCKGVAALVGRQDAIGAQLVNDSGEWRQRTQSANRCRRSQRVGMGDRQPGEQLAALGAMLARYCEARPPHLGDRRLVVRASQRLRTNTVQCLQHQVQHLRAVEHLRRSPASARRRRSSRCSRTSPRSPSERFPSIRGGADASGAPAACSSSNICVSASSAHVITTRAPGNSAASRVSSAAAAKCDPSAPLSSPSMTILRGSSLKRKLSRSAERRPKRARSPANPPSKSHDRRTSARVPPATAQASASALLPQPGGPLRSSTGFPAALSDSSASSAVRARRIPVPNSLRTDSQAPAVCPSSSAQSWRASGRSAIAN